jgi:hypothetical protein
LAIGLQPARPDALQAFCDSVSNPKSPNYRNFITPEEVGIRFGAAEADVDAVADYLQRNGMTISLIASNRMAILADSTVAQAEAAFHTTFSDFEASNPVGAGRITFHANTTPALLPTSLGSVVIDISGLEDYTRPMPCTSLLNPTLTRALYNTAPMYNAGNTGSGRTVAISNWDGYRLTNVPLYYSHFGLPTPPGGVGSNITVVSIDGGSGGNSAGGEGDLDIQMELGMAPLANMRIYDGAGGDLINVLAREVNDNLADCISESWGWSISGSGATSAHNQHLSMTAQGITYMCASGDGGTSVNSYPYPACDPEVLVVGGTVANVNSSTGVRTSEVGWSGSGGGWSTVSFSFNKLPSWQLGTGVPTAYNYRLFPDVGIHAAGSSGAYQFYYGGGLSSGSIGTSFASPVFAGCLAVAEQDLISLGGLPANASGKQRFGRIMDLFYSQNGRGDVWHDITSGSNGNLPSPPGGTSSCTPGWDTVTGWGAPDFNAFVLSQVNVGTTPATLTASNASGAIAQTIVLSATLVRTADSVPLAGKYVGFAVTGAGGASGVTDANGVATASYTVPDSIGSNSVAITASFAGDSVYAPATGSATLTVVPGDVALAVPSKSGQPGQTVSLAATLTRASDGTVLASQTVSFLVDGSNVGSGVTSARGTASYSYQLPGTLVSGAHTLQASFAGAPGYSPGTGNATLTVTKANTTTTASSASGAYGKSVSLSAVLRRTTDSAVLPGESVSFTIDGNAAGSATTDATGAATLPYAITTSLTTGAHAIGASFAAVDPYNASSGTATLTVSAANTALVVTAATGIQGGSANLVATLTRTTDNATLGAETVNFTVDGSPAGSTTTDGSGVATVSFSIPSGMTVGSHSIGASFAGDAHYNASTGSSTLTVNAGGTSVVSGIVELQIIADPTGQSSTLEFRTPGTTTAVFSTTITLDGTGNYSASDVPFGTYDVACKFSNWLRQVLPSVSISQPTTSAVDFSLVNGDANGDNKVTLMDLAVVLSNFNVPGATEGDLNWDGHVGVLDLGIVLLNFMSVGAP